MNAENFQMGVCEHKNLLVCSAAVAKIVVEITLEEPMLAPPNSPAN